MVARTHRTATHTKVPRSAGLLSMREAQQRRWERAAKTLIDFSCGTLWWVPETLWKTVLRQRYDRHSQRRGHPGLSIQQAPIADLYTAVPMLHGSSGGGPIEVRGLDERQPARRTWFGRLIRPVPRIPVAEWLPFERPARVRPNSFKPRLDPDEQAALVRFLERRNLEL